jgi:hypothetical protein
MCASRGTHIDKELRWGISTFRSRRISVMGDSGCYHTKLPQEGSGLYYDDLDD